MTQKAQPHAPFTPLLYTCGFLLRPSLPYKSSIPSIPQSIFGFHSPPFWAQNALSPGEPYLHFRRIADSPARDPALQVCLGHKHQVGVIRVGPVRLQQMADVVVNASESGARWHLVVLHALAKARGQVSCGVKAIIRVPADGAGSAPAGCSKASMSCMHLTAQLASTSSSYGHWQRIGLEYSLRSAVALMRELAPLILLPLFCHPFNPPLQPVSFGFLTSSNSQRTPQRKGRSRFVRLI